MPIIMESFGGLAPGAVRLLDELARAHGSRLGKDEHVDELTAPWCARSFKRLHAARCALPLPCTTSRAGAAAWTGAAPAARAHPMPAHSSIDAGSNAGSWDCSRVWTTTDSAHSIAAEPSKSLARSFRAGETEEADSISLSAQPWVPDSPSHRHQRQHRQDTQDHQHTQTHSKPRRPPLWHTFWHRLALSPANQAAAGAPV